MTRAAIALFILTVSFTSFLPSISARISSPFHKRCLNFNPLLDSKDTPPAVYSLVCGASLKDSVAVSPWRNLGLIHLLVVSGGHLMILAWCLSRARTPMWIRTPVLILFSLMNQLDPPVLRSLFGLLGSQRLRRLGWTPAESVLITTWLCLPFLDGPRDLSSLLMSFAASLALSWAGRNAPATPALQVLAVQMLIWWLLFPLLLPLNVAHPVASFSNVLLAPLIGWTLIPLGFAAWAIGGPMISVFEILWNTTNRTLTFIADRLPQPLPTSNAPQTALLAAFFLLIIYFIGDRDARKRQSSGRGASLWPVCILIAAMALSILVSQIAKENAAPQSAKAQASANGTKKRASPVARPFKADTKLALTRDKPCTQVQAILPLAHSKHCRRRR